MSLKTGSVDADGLSIGTTSEILNVSSSGVRVGTTNNGTALTGLRWGLASVTIATQAANTEVNADAVLTVSPAFDSVPTFVIFQLSGGQTNTTRLNIRFITATTTTISYRYRNVTTTATGAITINFYWLAIR